MRGNKQAAIGSLVFAVALAIAGIIVYTNDYILLVFGVIPLSAPVFGVISLLLLATAIFQLATAGKKDQQANQTFKEQATSAHQAALQGVGMDAPTLLDTPCTVNVRHIKGNIGWIYALNLVLNGSDVGALKNKQSLSFYTNVIENSLSVQHSGRGQTTTFAFVAAPGGTVNLSVAWGAKDFFTETIVVTLE